ncbi:ATPase expression protein 2, mitochondrial [Nakaseomyces bracarensis]|uniref:ATPase expression protein 2, mitochondrial n=1 Tax=Nakaseomyces bracarensis TaxID=273131 RepID=A0ABR4NZ49_9SACH
MKRMVTVVGRAPISRLPCTNAVVINRYLVGKFGHRSYMSTASEQFSIDGFQTIIERDLESITDINRRKLYLSASLNKWSEAQKLLGGFQKLEDPVQAALRFFESYNLGIVEFSNMIQPLFMNSKHRVKITKDNLVLISNIYMNMCRNLEDNLFSVVQLRDVNGLIRLLLKEKQLKQSQELLNCVIDSFSKKSVDILGPYGDVETIVHYLQLRAGSLHDFWSIKTTWKKTMRLYEINTTKKSPRFTYNLLEREQCMSIVNFLLHSNEMDTKSMPSYFDVQVISNIISSLGHLGETELIKKIILHIWGSDSNVPVVQWGIYPTSDVMISIISSISKQTGTIQQGLEILDKFLKLYPDMNLNHIFWSDLQRWNIVLGKDKRSTIDISKNCWQLMKKWTQNKTSSSIVPYNHELLKMVYPLLNAQIGTLKDLAWCFEIFEDCFIALYSKHKLNKHEKSLLRRYQILCVKKMAMNGYYKKCTLFIKEWSFNYDNKKELLEVFSSARNRYLNKHGHNQAKEMSKVQQKYDQEEEEDMLLGGLW